MNHVMGMRGKVMYCKVIKRMLAIILSVMGLFCLSWLFLLIMLAIKIDSKGPVFFKQKRVGIHKTHFEILKFRTMRIDTPKDMPTHLLENPDQYITRVGKFLRRTSLDELPQIFNILKGDMAIIGPRPALWNQFDLIEERDKYGANDVRPGLTGWAQINGRDELEIEEKARLDGYYVKRMSFVFDLVCFVGTIVSVLKSDGVVEGGTGAKKTIVVLSHHAQTTYSFRKEVFQRFVKAGYRVILIMPYDEYVERMKKDGCEFIDLPVFSRHSTNVLDEIRLILAYIKILKSIRPDIVVAYTIKPNLYGGLVTSLLRIPFIASVTGLGTAVENKGVVQKIVKLMYRICLRKAACVFVQNEKIEKFLVERKVKAKIVRIPGSGVNLKQHCFEKYPDNDGEIRFVTIARLMKDKGIDEILYAAKQIKVEYPNTRFQLIGFDDGNYKEIVEAAEKENQVEYLGFQDNVHQWIVKSHATIHPSYHEGMANVLLESAASGRPVIATDIPGCRETFDEGVSGISCKVRSKEDLVRAIRQFIELPYEKKSAMGIAGRTKMEKEFDRNIVVNAYLAEIKQLIG